MNIDQLRDELTRMRPSREMLAFLESMADDALGGIYEMQTPEMPLREEEEIYTRFKAAIAAMLDL